MIYNFYFKLSMIWEETKIIFISYEEINNEYQ